MELTRKYLLSLVRKRNICENAMTLLGPVGNPDHVGQGHKQRPNFTQDLIKKCQEKVCHIILLLPKNPSSVILFYLFLSFCLLSFSIDV